MEQRKLRNISSIQHRLTEPQTMPQTTQQSIVGMLNEVRIFELRF